MPIPHPLALFLYIYCAKRYDLMMHHIRNAWVDLARLKQVMVQSPYPLMDASWPVPLLIGSRIVS